MAVAVLRLMAPTLQIGLGRRALTEGNARISSGHVRDRVTGDGEFLLTACGMNTPYASGGMVLIPMKSCS